MGVFLCLGAKDGVFIGGKHLRYTHNTLKTMTNSFFSDQVDQELSLDDMKSVNGGTILLAPPTGIPVLAATFAKGIAECEELGTSLAEVINDLVGGDEGAGNGDVEVVYK